MAKTFNTKKYGVITITTERTRNSIIWTSSVNLTKEEAKIIQETMNYHPNGYGFMDFKGNKWTCWTSCD